MGGEQAGRVRGHDSQAGRLQLGGRGGGGPRPRLLPSHPSPRPGEGPQRRGAFPDFPGGGAVAEVEPRSLSCRGDGGVFGDLEARGMGVATRLWSGGPQGLSLFLQLCSTIAGLSFAVPARLISLSFYLWLCLPGSVSAGPQKWVWGPCPQEGTLPGTWAPPQWIVNPGCEEQL